MSNQTNEEIIIELWLRLLSGALCHALEKEEGIIVSDPFTDLRYVVSRVNNKIVINEVGADELFKDVSHSAELDDVPDGTRVWLHDNKIN